MTEFAQQHVSCRNDERGLWNCDPQRIADLISDADARRIFQGVAGPTTIADLSERLEIPSSTLYRKVELLEDAGLLSKTPPESVPQVYEREVDRISVCLADELRIVCHSDESTLYCTRDGERS